jgi:glycosyltransferase involved in cell wall biosynthesis
LTVLRLGVGKLLQVMHEATLDETIGAAMRVTPVAPPVASFAALVVAFHYPPIATAGTHRTVNFVRALAARGHRLGVVTTSAFTGFRLDDRLGARVPAEVAVARAPHLDPFRILHVLRGAGGDDGGATETAAQPAPNEAAEMVPPAGYLDRAIDFASRLADLPDRYSSWIVPAYVKGVALAMRMRAQVVYATAPPFSALLAGRAIAETLSLPLVVDLRDPWAQNPFRGNPFAWLRTLDAALERSVVRRATRVILNTPLAARDYVARYGDPQRFVTIPNGIDPSLFDLPRERPVDDGTITLLHPGTIYGRRSPLPLVAALARLARTEPRLASRVRIRQLGSVEDGGRLHGALAAAGLEDAFTLEPPRPHAEAFRAATAAHGLLLLGVSGPTPEIQVPAKLYEYLAAGRPILSLSKRGGAIEAVLERAGARFVLADPDDPDAIHDALRRFAPLADERSGSGAPAAAAYGYDQLALELEQLLAAAAKG